MVENFIKGVVWLQLCSQIQRKMLMPAQTGQAAVESDLK